MQIKEFFEYKFKHIAPTAEEISKFLSDMGEKFVKPNNFNLEVYLGSKDILYIAPLTCNRSKNGWFLNNFIKLKLWGDSPAMLEKQLILSDFSANREWFVFNESLNLTLFSDMQKIPWPNPNAQTWNWYVPLNYKNCEIAITRI